MSQFVCPKLPDFVYTVYENLQSGNYIHDETMVVLKKNFMELMTAYQQEQLLAAQLCSQQSIQVPSPQPTPVSLLDPTFLLAPYPKIDFIDLTQDDDDVTGNQNPLNISNLLGVSNLKDNEQSLLELPSETKNEDYDDAASDCTVPMYMNDNMNSDIDDEQNLDDDDDESVIIVDYDQFKNDNTLNDQTDMDDSPPSSSGSLSSTECLRADDPSEECEIEMEIESSDSSSNINLNDKSKGSECSPSPRASSSSSGSTTGNSATAESEVPSIHHHNKEAHMNVPSAATISKSKTSRTSMKSIRPTIAKIKYHPAPSFTNRKKQRKTDFVARANFDHWQIQKLEARFDKSQYITSAEKLALANSIKLSVHQIGVWFQNRRVKEKKIYEKNIKFRK